MSAKSPIVLVIDDDEGIQQYVMDMLNAMGYAPCAAADAEAATNLINNLPSIRILLCDIRLKAGTGPELIREVLHRGPDVKVVFMTGGFINVGFRRTDPVMIKPFRFEDLQRTIGAVLQVNVPLSEQSATPERRRWIRPS